MTKNDNFKNKLTIGKLKDKSQCVIGNFSLKRKYELSYKKAGFKSDPQDMDTEEIINYIQRNYISNKGRNNKAKLINDLIIFENYRDDLESIMKNRRDILDLWKYLITISVALVSLKNMLDKLEIEYYNPLPKAGPPMRILEMIIEMIIESTLRIVRFIIYSPEIRSILILCFLLSVIYNLIISYKNSKTNKLKTINQSIRVLENIKQHYY